MPEVQPQVVVVGAGPTGLLIALGLAQREIPVTVIEADPGINRSPRALTYTPVVLEVLDKFRVLDAARAVALQCGRVEWAFADNGHILEVDVAALGELSPFPFNLHMGQDTLADVILAELSKHPHASIRWNTRLDGLAQDSDHVTIDVTTDGREEQIVANWLIGADGARSSVRKIAGIEFEGFTWPDRFIATNISFDFHKLGFGPARFIIDPTDWALIARVDRGPLWRVTYGESADLPEETAGERARERLHHFTGSDDFEIVHASPYRVHERAAASFRDRRVLLAGDAAHTVNPLGGQGLTAGILDADMLVDTLSGVIKGTYPGQALDHYAAERRKMVTQASMGISKNTKRLVQEADPEQRRRDEAMMQEGIDDRKVMQQRMAAMMAVAGEPYAGS